MEAGMQLRMVRVQVSHAPDTMTLAQEGGEVAGARQVRMNEADTMPPAPSGDAVALVERPAREIGAQQQHRRSAVPGHGGNAGQADRPAARADAGVRSDLRWRGGCQAFAEIQHLLRRREVLPGPHHLVMGVMSAKKSHKRQSLYVCLKPATI